MAGLAWASVLGMAPERRSTVRVRIVWGMRLRRRRAQDWSEQYAAAMSDFGTGTIGAQTW